MYLALRVHLVYECASFTSNPSLYVSLVYECTSFSKGFAFCVQRTSCPLVELRYRAARSPLRADRYRMAGHVTPLRAFQYRTTGRTGAGPPQVPRPRAVRCRTAGPESLPLGLVRYRTAGRSSLGAVRHRTASPGPPSGRPGTGAPVLDPPRGVPVRHRWSRTSVAAFRFRSTALTLRLISFRAFFTFPSFPKQSSHWHFFLSKFVTSLKLQSA